MCQYSSLDGMANDWHLVHLGSRAVGGAALVMVEATAVEARGRISPQDMGLWSDAHVEPLRRIARFLREQGAVPGIQLAHAGRKASRSRPWEGDLPLGEAAGGWPTLGPSPIPFGPKDPAPREMAKSDIAAVVEAFHAAAGRALEAEFAWIELHAAHGYLCHSFYSPLANRRADGYGGDFENRVRFTLEALRAMRTAWPERLPLSVRLSCTDWVEGGWSLEDTLRLAGRLEADGADMIDCSSGGAVPGVRIPVAPGYQVAFSESVRRAGVPTAAVGMITAPAQADEIIRSGRADLVLLGREELRDPYWPIHAAQELGSPGGASVAPQYLRAFPRLPS